MGSYGGGMAGRKLILQTLALRVQTMERVREHLHQTFGNLPLGVMGHSLGAMTISLLNWNCPKMYHVWRHRPRGCRQPWW